MIGAIFWGILNLFLSTGHAHGQNLPSQIPLVAAKSIPPAPTPAPAPPAAAPAVDPALAAGLAKTQGSTESPDLLSGIIEDYTYIPGNKRDPFLPYETVNMSGVMVGPVFPLQKFEIDQLKLIGIIWDVKNPKAMLLDPQGVGYVVKVNERIGRNNGYIARIRESEVVIIEKLKSNDGTIGYVTKLMKLAN
jgi:type IV pilus assembly protein PilP